MPFEEGREPWQNAFCISLETPNDTYMKSKNESHITSGRGWTNTQEYDSWFPHSNCEEYLTMQGAHERFLGGDGTPTKDKVQLQLLRACRQAYFEANEALWSNTTFSFNDPHSFHQFMTSRTAYQRKLLRKLHFEVLFLLSGDVKAWEKVLSIALVRSLTGLHDFHLNVRHESTCHILYLPGLPQGYSDSCRHIFFENLLNFQILPLRNVTVVWQRHYGNDTESEDWSHTKNREWAEFFRQRYLDPRGLNVWQEYKDWQKSFGKREKEAIVMKRLSPANSGDV